MSLDLIIIFAIYPQAFYIPVLLVLNRSSNVVERAVQVHKRVDSHRITLLHIRRNKQVSL